MKQPQNKPERNNSDLGAVGSSLPLEIYVTYDRSDGEIFCAFIDKEQCKREAEECGCGMQTVRLVGKQ
jgi:hypothetical protein